MESYIPQETCMNMTLKQIRATPEYKKLSPLGKINASGTYHYGNKSSANKKELCWIMSHPVEYQKKVQRNKELGINTAKRKRSTRKGKCLYPRDRKPKNGACKSGKFPYLGITTTGEKCCYKKQQTEKTKRKRLGKAMKKSKK
jgi:hypothetical protein